MSQSRGYFSLLFDDLVYNKNSKNILPLQSLDIAFLILNMLSKLEGFVAIIC